MTGKDTSQDIRICIELRYLNASCIAGKHEIVLLRSILATLAEAKCKYYSVCDIKHAYFQVPLEESCKHLTGLLWKG